MMTKEERGEAIEWLRGLADLELRGIRRLDRERQTRMAKWTIANLSDLSAPFVDVFAEPFSNQLSVASSVNPSNWWDSCGLEFLEAILPSYANGSLRGVDIHDPLGLLEGAKVVSVESVYHAMELGRANV